MPATPGRRVVVLIAVAVTLALAYPGWLLVRDSSLVAVRDVKVEGVSADRGRVIAALTDAAHGMTTLDVRTDRLAAAVQGFPTVASVSADASFPHGLTIHVSERKPVLVASDGAREAPVAADGSLLPGLQADGRRLPLLTVDSLPPAGSLSGDALGEALVIGAAPAPLRQLVARATVSSDYGIVVGLRGGIELRFGSSGQADAKWAAVAAILADPKLTSLSYVNVRVPERPAVG
jgi:cell division protein FtsQ